MFNNSIAYIIYVTADFALLLYELLPHGLSNVEAEVSMYFLGDYHHHLFH